MRGRVNVRESKWVWEWPTGERNRNASTYLDTKGRHRLLIPFCLLFDSSEPALLFVGVLRSYVYLCLLTGHWVEDGGPLVYSSRH